MAAEHAHEAVAHAAEHVAGQDIPELPNMITVLDVKRARSVIVQYTNEQNRMVERKLTELAARVFQHESDHLNGKLIIDYVGPLERLKIEELIKNPPKEKPKTHEQSAARRTTH